MIPGRVSIILPSRNEQFLSKTVADVLRNARGDVEVIPVLDNHWPDPALDDSDKRLVILHKGTNEGMRPAINDGIRISTGEFILKADAHCAFAEGFDVVLKADHQPNWVQIPRRYALDPVNWKIEDTGKGPIDFHYLSYPYERPGDPACGLHGTAYRKHSAKRAHILIDDEMSSQGSCWFMTRKWWDAIGEGDVKNYGNFINEMQELLKVQALGGAMKVNKKIWYAHLHKGPLSPERPWGGRGYWISKAEMQRGAIYTIQHWMHEGAATVRRLVEQFSEIMGQRVPTWPADLDEAFRPRKYINGIWELA